MLILPVLVRQRPALLKPYLMLGGLMKTIPLRLTFTYVHIHVQFWVFFLSYGLNHRLAPSLENSRFKYLV